MNMNVKITNNPMAFEILGCPAVNAPYIVTSYRSIITNIDFDNVYYWNNAEKNELTAFKVLAIAILAERQSYFLQFPNKKMWIENFFEKEEKNIFSCKEDFFSNIKTQDNFFHQKHSSFSEVFSEYKYSSVIGFKYHTYVWRDSAPSSPKDVDINYFLITKSGATVCIAQKDAERRTIYLNKTDCIKSNLDGMTIKDFASDVEDFHFDVGNIKEETHTIRILEI